MNTRLFLCALAVMALPALAAIQRDYAVWVVSNAKVVDDPARVGFLKSESDDAVKTSGKGIQRR